MFYIRYPKTFAVFPIDFRSIFCALGGVEKFPPSRTRIQWARNRKYIELEAGND